MSLYLGRISAFEIGFLPGLNFSFSPTPIFKKAVFYFLAVDNYSNLKNNSFIVYQGFFRVASFLFRKAKLIFPVATYLERVCTYLNLEGRLRVTKAVITPFKFVFSDFEVVRALFLLHKRILVNNNFSKVKNFFPMVSLLDDLIDYNPKILHVSNIRGIFFNNAGLNLAKGYMVQVSRVLNFWKNVKWGFFF